jgi:predicted phosphodiesterase
MQATPVSGRRFGVTADTHDDLCDWPAVLAGLTAAWGRVDAILHCGDVTSPLALETLAAIAPVYATRSDGDPPAAPPQLDDGPRLLALDGVRVGLTFAGQVPHRGGAHHRCRTGVGADRRDRLRLSSAAAPAC